MTYLLIIATGYGDIMAFTLQSIIHIGGNSADAHNMKARLAFVAVCMGMVYTNIFRPMMEDGNRPACLHTVDSKLTGPIMTTKENADTHNHLIKHVKPFLPDGSYLISDGSLTAISLLGCRPYAVFSTVFSADAMNERYIRFAFNHTHRLPYYLADAEAQNEKNLFVLNCLKTISPYKAVWTDGRFTLWKPETDNGERKQKEKD